MNWRTQANFFRCRTPDPHPTRQGGGTVAPGGIHMSPIPSIDYGLLYQERVIRGAEALNELKNEAIRGAAVLRV